MTGFSLRQMCIAACLGQLLLAATAPARAQAAPAGSSRPNPFPEFDVTSSFALSPDGQYLAAGVQIQDLTGVLVYETDDEDFTLFDAGDARINWIRWADERRLLASLRVLVPRGSTSPSRLAMILPAARRTVSLSDTERLGLSVVGQHQMQDDVVGIVPGDGTRLLLSYPTSASLIRMNLASRQAREVGGIPSRMDWLFTDQTGAPRIGIDWQRRTLERRFSPREILEVTERLFVRAPGEDEFRESYKRLISQTPVFVPISFDASNPDTVYVVSNHRDETLALYEWSTSNGSFSSNPVTPLRSGLLRIVMNPQRTKILGVRHVSQDNHISWLQPAHSELMAAIRAALDGATIDVVGVSDGLEYVALLATGAQDAGTYYLYESSTRTLRPLWRDRPGWGNRSVLPVQRTEIPRQDNSSLPAYLSRRDTNASDARRPTAGVVVVHDGTYATDFYRFNSLVQRLATSGIVVLQIADSRSQRFHRHNTYYVEWSPSDIEDIVTASQWLADTQLAGDANVCVYGIGYAGYGALLAGAQSPDLFACIAASNAPTDLNMLDELNFHHFIPRQPPRTASPIAHVEEFSAPVFLAHGRQNRQVPAYHSERLRTALEQHGKDVVYMELETEDHEVRDFDTQRRLEDVLLAFLNEHLR